jgi:hypothetical protein
MVLTRLFGIKSEKVTEGHRKLHNQQLHNFYSLPNIVRMIKSLRTRWAVHVAHIGEKIHA